MLLDAGLAFEGGGDDGRGVVIAVAAKVVDADLGVGETGLDQPFDLARVDCHTAPFAKGLWSGGSAGHVLGQPSLVEPNKLCDGYGIAPGQCQLIAPGGP